MMETRRSPRAATSPAPPASAIPRHTAGTVLEAEGEPGAVEFNLILRGLLHELRNPLSSILTAANLVSDTAREEAQIGEETEMLLGVIKKESLRLNRILTEFADFIKLPEPQPVRFDCAQLAREVAAQLRREGVLVADVEIVDELPEQCAVWADRNLIRIALHHILRNAGEAMPEGGVLRLWLAPCAETVVLCIGDSGNGFSEESRARAFEPFYSTKLHATGLGLTAARTILEAAGGTLRLLDRESSTPPMSTNHAGRSLSPLQVCLEVPRAEGAHNSPAQRA
jgi:signal transduction histidine kinase